MKMFNRKLITSLVLGATLAPLTIIVLAGCGSGGSSSEGVDTKTDTLVDHKETGANKKGEQMKAKLSETDK